MKIHAFLSIMAFSLIATSCVVTKKTSIKVPVMKTKTEPVVIRKNGLKCNLRTASEQKEIFLEIEVIAGKRHISFYEFLDAKRVSVMQATIEGYLTLGFDLTETIVNDQKFSIGSSTLYRDDKTTISSDYKVFYSTGKLTFDDSFTGKLEVSHFVKTPEDDLQTTAFEELATIERCDKFKTN